jgi:hypothetical protein
VKNTRVPSACLILLITLLYHPTSWAATITSFQIEANWSRNPDPAIQNYHVATRDVRLDSVTFDGETFSDFQLVSDANVIRNDVDNVSNADPDTGVVREPFTIINTGRGQYTDVDPWVDEGPLSGPDGATNADLVATYASRNLNSINYNRERKDYGIFTISFPRPTDAFFIFERGMDSDIHLEALRNGEVVGSWDFTWPLVNGRHPWPDAYYAGFDIVTYTGYPGWITDPNRAQRVGAIGIRLDGGAADTLRFTVNAIPDFGPDLKVFGGAPASESGR